MGDIFQGRLVRLRAIEPSDWEAHYHWNLDTDSARLSYDLGFPTSRESVKAWADAESRREPRNDEFRFQIARVDGPMVGTLLTHHCDLRHGTFMYGIAVMPEHRGKGYASEAIRLLLRYFFQERRYQKVTAEVYSFNEASIRLHERLGFTLEGRLRRMIFTEGQHFDTLVYGMTSEEFETGGEPQGD
jgi:RimJ/RimL family protein N-acetyltransferase